MSKDTCDGRRSFNTKLLKKYRYFDAGIHNGTIRWRNEHTENYIDIQTEISEYGSLLTLNYNWWPDDATSVQMKYVISLVSTACHFGGKRWWFICPLTYEGVVCNRRVGKLYALGKWFGCRHCGDLAYDSQYERRGGYFGILRPYYKLIGKINALPPPRIKLWLGRITKRYQKYLALRKQVFGVEDEFVTLNNKMNRWLKKKKRVK